MAFDLARSRASLTEEVQVAPGQTISEEGRVLISTLVNGVENAQYSAGGSTTENLIGFSVNTAIVDGFSPYEETVVFGAGSPPAGINLTNGNITASSTMRVYNTTTSTLFTLGDPTSSSTAFSINVTSGLLTVGSAGANSSFNVQYRYALTALEIQMMPYLHQRPVNFGATTLYNTIAIMRGNGNIYTNEWDTSLDWTTEQYAYALAQGYFGSTSASNTVIGRIISQPTATDLYVGVAFNFA